MTRCPKRDKAYPIPAGMTIEAASNHPTNHGSRRAPNVNTKTAMMGRTGTAA